MLICFGGHLFLVLKIVGLRIQPLSGRTIFQARRAVAHLAVLFVNGFAFADVFSGVGFFFCAKAVVERSSKELRMADLCRVEAEDDASFWILLITIDWDVQHPEQNNASVVPS